MTDWSNTDNARAALADPNLPAGELAAITAAQPSLWPQVAAHPAAYPDLLGWLAAQGVPVPPRAQPPVSQPTPAAGIAAAPVMLPVAATAAPAVQAAPAVATAAAPGAAQQNLPPNTPPARPRKHRRGLIIAIVAAAVVVVVGVAAIVWATNQPSAAWQPSRIRTVPPGVAPDLGTPSAPTQAGTPAPGSSAPEPTAPQPSVPGQVAVVPSQTPVPIAPGETLYSGTANMGSDYQVDVGFILSADGTSIHDVTVAVSGGQLQAQYGFSRISDTSSQSYDIGHSTATVTVTDGVSLSVSLANGLASGSLSYNVQLGGIGGQPTKQLDLGTGFFSLEAS